MGIGAQIRDHRRGRHEAVQRSSPLRSATPAPVIRAFISALGASKTIREIDITWPSRIHQVLHNVAADQILTVEEPAR